MIAFFFVRQVFYIIWHFSTATHIALVLAAGKKSHWEQHFISKIVRTTNRNLQIIEWMVLKLAS